MSIEELENNIKEISQQMTEEKSDKGIKCRSKQKKKLNIRGIVQKAQYPNNKGSKKTYQRKWRL